MQLEEPKISMDQQLVRGGAPHLCHASSEQQHKAGSSIGCLEHGPSGSMNSQNSFAEALLFAQVTRCMACLVPIARLCLTLSARWQSRAREAEEVLYSYDVRVEEAVLRALTLLDASRHKEMLCRQRLEQLKAAVLEEEERAMQLHDSSLQGESDLDESLLEDALQRTVLRGVSHVEHAAATAEGADDSRAAGEGAEQGEVAAAACGLLQGAYQKLVAVAITATSSPVPEPEMAPATLQAADATFDLSMALAQAYADLGDAQENTSVPLASLLPCHDSAAKRAASSVQTVEGLTRRWRRGGQRAAQGAAGRARDAGGARAAVPT